MSLCKSVTGACVRAMCVFSLHVDRIPLAYSDRGPTNLLWQALERSKPRMDEESHSLRWIPRLKELNTECIYCTHNISKEIGPRVGMGEGERDTSSPWRQVSYTVCWIQRAPCFASRFPSTPQTSYLATRLNGCFAVMSSSRVAYFVV